MPLTPVSVDTMASPAAMYCTSFRFVPEPTSTGFKPYSAAAKTEYSSSSVEHTEQFDIRGQRLGMSAQVIVLHASGDGEHHVGEDRRQLLDDEGGGFGVRTVAAAYEDSNLST